MELQRTAPQLHTELLGVDLGAQQVLQVSLHQAAQELLQSPLHGTGEHGCH
jgi:hypothetical protein